MELAEISVSTLFLFLCLHLKINSYFCDGDIVKRTEFKCETVGDAEEGRRKTYEGRGLMADV